MPEKVTMIEAADTDATVRVALWLINMPRMDDSMDRLTNFTQPEVSFDCFSFT